MHRSSFATTALVWLSVSGMCLPWHVATAQQPPNSGSTAVTFRSQAELPIADVALGKGGFLQGQVYGPGGRPEANVEVALTDGEHTLAAVRTDSQGRFAFQGVRGGAHQLLAAGATQVVRTWAADTAPPAARPAALLVVDDQVVRGQQYCGCGDTVNCSQCGGAPGGGYGGGRPIMQWMRRNPGIVMAGVAAAVAIPVAIAASDDDDPAS